MKTSGPARAVTLAALVALGTSCSTSAQQSKAPGPADAAAMVGTVVITFAEVDKKAMQEAAGSFGSLTLAQAVYESRRAAAEELAGNMLLDAEAKNRKVEREALEEAEVTSKVAPVAEADVQAWYQGNPQRVQGAPIDQVRAPIQSLLRQERFRVARDAFIGTLKAKTPVRVMIEPPRTSVTAGSAPAKGSASAPIEVIEYADFECPYCLAAAPTVKRVLDTYGDQVRLVYRHYPLPNHPNARPAAEASMCAHEQGQFWAYHDRLFTEQGKLSVADLKQAAATLGLDAPRFNKCVDDHKFKSVVDADAQSGTDAGVNGTPAFFINGRPITGAQPFEAFKRIIDEELEFKKK